MPLALNAFDFTICICASERCTQTTSDHLPDGTCLLQLPPTVIKGIRYSTWGSPAQRATDCAARSKDIGTFEERVCTQDFHSPPKSSALNAPQELSNRTWHFGPATVSFSHLSKNQAAVQIANVAKCVS